LGSRIKDWESGVGAAALQSFALAPAKLNATGVSDMSIDQEAS